MSRVKKKCLKGRAYEHIKNATPSMTASSSNAQIKRGEGNRPGQEKECGWETGGGGVRSVAERLGLTGLGMAALQ